MPSEYLNGHGSVWCFQIGCSVFNIIGRCAVRELPDWVVTGFHQFFYLRVFLIVGKTAPVHNALDEDLELLPVVFKGGENIDMIPGNPAYQGNIRLIQVKFWPAVYGRGKVLIPFEDDKITLFCKPHHTVESFELCPNHVIYGPFKIVHNMQYHGRYGGFTVAPADHHPGFVFGLLKKEFRVAVKFQVQFLCPTELRVIWFGMHAKDDCIEFRSYAFGEPPEFIRQQASALQTAPGWLINDVIAPRNLIPFVVEGQCQVVHGTTSDGYKMYPHIADFPGKDRKRKEACQPSGPC